MDLEHLFTGTFKGKKVFLTGHTGFKGSWMSILLKQLGAELMGYALAPPTKPSLFEEVCLDTKMSSVIGDIRDIERLQRKMQEFRPEIVIHMAAQPLVRDSYKMPVDTYSVNVMGTVHILEACRNTPSVKAIVNVTTDKCYENKEWHWGYRENEPMGGYDPYSNSKGCSELVTAAYRNSYFNPGNFKDHGVALASARAGNVIGGGDWANDRLIPDFIRSIEDGQVLRIRSPYAIRPWQHVLEPLSGYLTLAAALYKEGSQFAQGWNFGPEESDAKNVEWISKNICSIWGSGAAYEIDSSPQPHEASYLKLDCSKAKAKLNWQPRWNIEKALRSIVDWQKNYLAKGDVYSFTISQMESYFGIKL